MSEWKSVGSVAGKILEDLRAAAAEHEMMLVSKEEAAMINAFRAKAPGNNFRGK